MWIVVALAVGALATGTETSEITTVKTVQDSNAQFEVTGWVERETITSGERTGCYGEKAYLKVRRISDSTIWESPIESTAGIDAVRLTGDDQFVTVLTIIQHRGNRIVRWKISDSGVPEEIEKFYGYWPYLAPNQKWVFYQHWYPRMGTPKEYQHTSTWMVDITRPEFKPVLVYPPDSPTGSAPDGRIHSALTSGITPLWTTDSRKLYYFDKLSPEHDWKGAVVSLVEIQVGEDMTVEKTNAYPVKAADFAKPGADLTKLAFCPKELHWAGEGLIGGKLDPKPGWKSETILMTTTGEYLDPGDTEKQEGK